MENVERTENTKELVYLGALLVKDDLYISHYADPGEEPETEDSY